jgi:hypothetical protein
VLSPDPRHYPAWRVTYGATQSGVSDAAGAKGSARLCVVTFIAEPAPLWSDALASDPDRQAALAMGIDLFLIEENLRMTPAQRIQMLESMDELFVRVHGSAWKR